MNANSLPSLELLAQAQLTNTSTPPDHRDLNLIPSQQPLSCSQSPPTVSHTETEFLAAQSRASASADLAGGRSASSAKPHAGGRPSACAGGARGSPVSRSPTARCSPVSLRPFAGGARQVLARGPSACAGGACQVLARQPEALHRRCSPGARHNPRNPKPSSWRTPVVLIHKHHGTLLQHCKIQDHEGPPQTGQVLHRPMLQLLQMLLQLLHLHRMPIRQVLLMLFHAQVHKLNLQQKKVMKM
jgi:hypothetical protein